MDLYRKKHKGKTPKRESTGKKMEILPDFEMIESLKGIDKEDGSEFILNVGDEFMYHDDQLTTVVGIRREGDKVMLYGINDEDSYYYDLEAYSPDMQKAIKYRLRDSEPDLRKRLGHNDGEDVDILIKEYYRAQKLLKQGVSFADIDDGFVKQDKQYYRDQAEKIVPAYIKWASGMLNREFGIPRKLIEVKSQLDYSDYKIDLILWDIDFSKVDDIVVRLNTKPLKKGIISFYHKKSLPSPRSQLILVYVTPFSSMKP